MKKIRLEGLATFIENDERRLWQVVSQMDFSLHLAAQSVLDAGCCYRRRDVAWCLSVGRYREPCKNGATNRDAVGQRNHILQTRCTLAPLGEYDVQHTRLALTHDITYEWPRLSVPGELLSWPIHTQNHQDLIWNVRTDTTDRITFPINVKKLFLFGHVFKSFLNVFLFSKRFLLLKTLAKFRAANRLTRSTFKITARK